MLKCPIEQDKACTLVKISQQKKRKKKFTGEIQDRWLSVFEDQQEPFEIYIKLLDEFTECIPN